MSEKIRKKPYEARVEYRAVQEDVEECLEAGYSIRIVYEHLFNTGRVTMCYSAFCDYVRGRGDRLHTRLESMPEDQEQPATSLSISLGRKTLH